MKTLSVLSGRPGCHRRRGTRRAAAILTFLALTACAIAPIPGGSENGAEPGVEDVEGPASPRGANYLLSIVPTNATKWVDASTLQKSATYGFQVKNTGDSSLPYCDLQLYPWTFGVNWSYNLIPSAPFEVSTGEPKTVLMVIYPAADAEAKRYTFSLKGKGTGVIANSISINLDVKQYAGVLVKAPPAQKADPGGTLEFVFEIVNTGNAKDRFFIESVEASVTGIQPYLKDNNNWTTDLAPGKSAFKTVVVQLPFNLKATSDPAGIQVTLTVRSNFNGASKDVNWTLLGVARLYDLSLGVSAPAVSVLPGRLAELTVSIMNLGNGPDTVTLEVSPGFDTTGWNIHPREKSFLIASGRTNHTALSVTPPPDALVGDRYLLEIVARSSGPPAPERPLERDETVTITVKRVRGLVTPEPHISVPGPVLPGQPLGLPFNLTNIGNGEELVNITILEKPEGWTAVLDKSKDLRMPPRTSIEGMLLVQVPVDPGKARCGSHLIRLRAAGSAAGPFVDLTLEINVGPVYGWTFGVAGNGTARVNPWLKDSCTFALELRNTGNAGDMLELKLSGGPAGFASLGTTAVALGSGQTSNVRLEIRVPRTAEPGSDHLFRVVARSLNEPALAREVEVSVSVASVDLAVVPAGQLEMDNIARRELRLEAGGTVEIGVTVRNDGADTAPAAIVRFYDNGVLFAEKNTTTLRPLRTSILTASWASNLSGRHLLRVEIDPENRLGEFNLDNNGGSCVIEVLEPEAPRTPVPPVNWQAPLSVVAACACAVLAFIAYRRRSGVDRELYESIYGKG